jgi:hypothetical protein
MPRLLTRTRASFVSGAHPQKKRVCSVGYTNGGVDKRARDDDDDDDDSKKSDVVTTTPHAEREGKRARVEGQNQSQ